MFKEHLRECWGECAPVLIFFAAFLSWSACGIGLICNLREIGMDNGLAFVISFTVMIAIVPFLCAAYKTWIKPRFGHWFP